jgi:hypothetical protein
LWHFETNDTNSCSAPNSSGDLNNPSNYINVQDRFDIILKIYFAYFITEVVRSIIMLIAACAKSKALACIYTVLAPNDCLGLAALIILHVYRFQDSGKYCSGDQSTLDSYDNNIGVTADDILDNQMLQSHFLIRRGRYLLGLVIYVWVGGCGLCCVSCIIAAIAAKKAAA